jgi:hypothetical protein
MEKERKIGGIMREMGERDKWRQIDIGTKRKRRKWRKKGNYSSDYVEEEFS